MLIPFGRVIVLQFAEVRCIVIFYSKSSSEPTFENLYPSFSAGTGITSTKTSSAFRYSALREIA